MESHAAEILIKPGKNTTRPAVGETVLITKEISNTILPKWQGKVQQIQDIPLENDIMKIIAYDLKFKINFINVKNSGYASSKGSTIFSTEVETPSITDLTLGSVDTTDSVLDTISFGKSISGADSKVTRSSAFEMIQVMGDRDIYIHRDGTADFLNGAGTNRSATHILLHGLNGILSPDIGYSEDEIRKVKQVIVKGAGTGSNFILGTAGTPLSTDKVKQIDLPYIASNATATLAATTIYNEFNKTNKYAKFVMTPDIFITNYDVFDTVKLKARLTNKTIDENLKIFSIETVVSIGADFHETVTLELQNFTRAQLAPTLNPIEASTVSLATIKTGIEFTQSNINTLPVTFGTHSSAFISATVTASETTVVTIGTFSSQKTSGAFVYFSVKCVIKTNSGGVTDIVIRFYVSDGTTNYPISMSMDHAIGRGVGDELDIQMPIFIPTDVSGKTITLKAIANENVDVTGYSYMHSLGL